MVRRCLYSVPARFIGRRVRVRLGASELVVFDGRAEIARHARWVQKGSQTLQLDHYLEVLVRKPGALPGSTPLAQARKTGAFTNVHEAFWAAARKRHGDADGTRVLVEVLLLHRHLAAEDVIAGLAAAVNVGATSADVVAVEARLAADIRADLRGASEAGTLTAATTPATRAKKNAAHKPIVARRPTAARIDNDQRNDERVVSLTKRRLRDLPPDTRPLPSVDQLLRKPQTATQTGAASGGTA